MCVYINIYSSDKSESSNKSLEDSIKSNTGVTGMCKMMKLNIG